MPISQSTAPKSHLLRRMSDSSSPSAANRRRLSLSLAAFLLCSLSACDQKRGGPGGDKKGDHEKKKEEDKPSPVMTQGLKRATLESVLRSASTIEAELSVTVHAEATGRISQVRHEEGDKVKKGTRLGQIRPDAQSSLLERASVNLGKLESDLKRVEALFQQGAASAQELEDARNAVNTARLDQQDRNREMKETRVHSPFSGTITERFVNNGAYVSTGAQLYSITDFSTLVARVYVPEKELDRIAVGQRAEIVGKAAKGRHGVGSIKRIAPIVDAATGTVKVTVALPTELSGGPEGFLPGMYAEVVLTTEKHENALVVPKSALVREEERVFVYTAEGKNAKRVMIETGIADDDNVEVLSGLKDDDEIIVAGQVGLKDGAKIIRVDDKGKPLPGEVEEEEGSTGEENEKASETIQADTEEEAKPESNEGKGESKDPESKTNDSKADEKKSETKTTKKSSAGSKK